MKRYAEDLGLDLVMFERDRTGDGVGHRVARDFTSGLASGKVAGTPTLFIGGAVHLGSYDAQTLLEALTRATP